MPAVATFARVCAAVLASVIVRVVSFPSVISGEVGHMNLAAMAIAAADRAAINRLQISNCTMALAAAAADFVNISFLWAAACVAC